MEVPVLRVRFWPCRVLPCRGSFRNFEIQMQTGKLQCNAIVWQFLIAKQLHYITLPNNCQFMKERIVWIYSIYYRIYHIYWIYARQFLTVLRSNALVPCLGTSSNWRHAGWNKWYVLKTLFSVSSQHITWTPLQGPLWPLLSKYCQAPEHLCRERCDRNASTKHVACKCRQMRQMRHSTLCE